MKYALQISTGNFSECTIEDTRELKRRLEELLTRLPVSRILYGWGKKEGVMESILELGKKYGAECDLWLPVLADVEHPEAAHPLVSAGLLAEHRDAQTCPGETFAFICPRSAENRALVMDSFERLSAGCLPDGVFLDRIRYPSAVFSFGDFFGCWCSHCRELARENGLDPKRLRRRLKDNRDPRNLLPISIENGCYHYADTDLERLCELKRQTITQAVKEYAEAFHRRGLKLGIDVFAPSLADFVGQDLNTLATVVDFMKPMMYYQTAAPAGIPYELNAYGPDFQNRLAKLWKAETDRPSGMTIQLQSIERNHAAILPGIEVNRVPGICEPGPESLKNAVQSAEAAFCGEIVCSWNALSAPEEIIRCLETLA